MKMIFIFIDGFGMGEDDPGKNPIVKAKTPGIDHIMSISRVYSTDSSLGVPGLPQSATGQTAIFTGVNAPKVLGRHLSGRPTLTLKKILYESGMMRKLVDMGLKVTNANVYRDEYLAKMLDPKDRRNRPSTTSVMTMAAGLKFRTVEEYNNGKGIYHDITGNVLLQSGYETDIITPEVAADRLYSISREYDFTLYEHFTSDIIGHKGGMQEAVKEIELLDAFLGRLFNVVDLSEYVIIITSDHGNIEDISVKTHTLNKVPTIIAGNIPEGYEIHIESLTDIMPAVLGMFRM